MGDQDLFKLIAQSAGDRTRLIDALWEELESKIAGAQRSLLQTFITQWVDKLDADDTGHIKNTLKNKRALDKIQDVFQQFVKVDGLDIVQTIIDGVDKITGFNNKYFKLFTANADLIPIQPQVTTLLESWLGLNGNGWLTGNGYLSKLISDPRVLNELQNLGLRAVVGQQGFQDFKSQLGDFIDGNKSQAGLLQKYSRNFAYDMYSQVDRATAKTYATKLNLGYAIYEGGLIKTSRAFCKEHDGNVYTQEEIDGFDPKEAVPPNYQPEIDLGGYGCRHHLNWVPEAIAFMLRPELSVGGGDTTESE